MKQITLLFIALLMISTSISAKEKSVIGSWLLTTVEEKGKTEEVYSEITFKDDGYAEWEGRVFGKWEHNKKSFTIESEMIKEIAAEWKVSKFKNGELVLTKPGSKLSFIRLDKTKIEEDNKNSGLEGMWKVEEVVLKASEEAIEEAVEEITEEAVEEVTEEATEDTGNEEYSEDEWEDSDSETDKTLFFNLPNIYKGLENFSGGSSSSSGTWIYNEAKKSLIIMTRDYSLNGLNKVVKLTDTELVLENKQNIVTAKKVKLQNIEIVRLGFTEKDFFDENGDYKYYDDEEKLPWTDPYEMMEFLKNVKELTYNYSLKIKDTESFDTKEITATVTVNAEEELIKINDIFSNHDMYSHSSEKEYPDNYFNFSNDNRLFPLSGQHHNYRIAGKEKITTPAGTFDCTIIDVCGSFDQIFRIWMINDKPGIFAKFIAENPDNFNEDFVYKFYELIKIK